jgi:hypothetical protein
VTPPPPRAAHKTANLTTPPFPARTQYRGSYVVGTQLWIVMEYVVASPLLLLLLLLRYYARPAFTPTPPPPPTPTTLTITTH